MYIQKENMNTWRFLLTSFLLLLIAECPDGFTALTKLGPHLHSTTAWGCYRLSQQKATLQEAEQFCESISYQGRLIGATLASDKNEESHKILVNLANGTHVYIGVSMAIINGENKVFKYSFDNTPVGDIDGKTWHGVYSDLGAGWLNDGDVAMRLQHLSGKCLSVLYPTSDIHLPLCSETTVSRWRFALNMLMDTNPSDRDGSFQCLTVDAPLHSRAIYKKFGLSTSDISNFLVAKKVVGKRCDLKDPNQKWTMKNNSIFSMTSGMVLSTNNKSVIVQDPHIMEWFADARYSGKKRLEVMLDESTIWYQLRAKDLDNCFDVFEEQLSGRVAPIMYPCDKNKHSQHWTELWSTSHLMNRKYSKCLAVNSTGLGGATKFADVAAVYLEDCILEKPEQIFLRTRHKSDPRNDMREEEDYYYKYALTKANYFISHASCQPSFLAFDMKAVCAHDLDVEDSHTIFLLPNKNQVSAKKEMFEIVNQAVPHLCLRVRKISTTHCAGSIIYVGRCDQKLAPGSWWLWTGKGTMLMSVDMGEIMCCMTLTESGKLVLQDCRDTKRNQMFKLEQGETGTRIISVSGTMILTADHVSVINDESTAKMIAKWNVLSNQGGRGVLDTLTDCRPQTPAGRIKYEGTRSFTSQGMECQSWRSQWPREHVFHMRAGPLCRKPESWRLTDSQPWCIVRNSDSNLVVGECTLPDCAENLGVYLSPNGSWVITGGLKRRRFICEAPVDCVNDKGADYNGMVHTANTGEACMNWVDRDLQLTGKSFSSLGLNHSFCRNPDSHPGGVWCWVKLQRREDCSQIRQCNSCVDPPTLYKGKIVAIKSDKMGFGYLSGATVNYSCSENHVRSHILVNHDLICANGTWMGEIPACNPTRCKVATGFEGIKNAQMTSPVSHVPVGATVEYKCNHGTYIGFHGAFSDTIRLRCDGRNVWSTVATSELHKSMENIRDLSRLSCQPSCNNNPPFTTVGVGQWCLAMSDNTKLKCPSGYRRGLPPEVALNSDFQSMFHNLGFNKTYLGVASRTENGNGGSAIPAVVFRSELTGDALVPYTHYNPDYFHIAAGTWEYCLGVSINDNLIVRSCQGEEMNNAFLFRWYRLKYIMNIKTGKCLEGSNAVVAKRLTLSECDIGSDLQKWNCTGNMLKYSFGVDQITLAFTTDSTNKIPITAKDVPSSYHKVFRVYESGCSDSDVTLMCAKPLPAMCEDPPKFIANAKRHRHYSKEDSILTHYQFKVKKGSEVIPYEFGREITYDCDYGFQTTTDGRKLKITCRTDGKWFPRSPGCSNILCSKPVDSPYAYPLMLPKNTVKLPLNTEISVRCISGFEISPEVISQTSVCTALGWSPPIAWCRIALCPRPALGDGMLYAGNTHRVGNRITVRCQYGLEISIGRTVSNTSIHICHRNGVWVPSLAILKCLPYYCPPPIKNIVDVHGLGRNQLIVIGCEIDETLINGTRTVPSGSVTAYCGKFKKWIPDVSKLSCRRKVCSIPVIGSMDLAKLDIQTEYNDDHTLAEITCPAHHRTTRFFKIYFHGNAVATTCLEGDVAHDVVMASNDKRCNANGSSLGMYWRWHPQNLNLLQNLANLKCLAAYDLSQALRHARPAPIGLKDCVTSGQAGNQKWDCYIWENVRFLGLYREESADSFDIIRDGVMSIRLDDMNLVLDSFSNVQASHRALPDGNSICEHRQYTSSVTLSCSSSGEWSPSPLDYIVCVKSTCPAPQNTSGLIFFGATNSNGDPIPHNQWNMSSSYHTSFKVECDIDFSPHNALSSTILCKSNGIWDPPLESFKCKHFQCSDLNSFADIEIVEETGNRRSRSYATIRCSPGKRFKNRKLEQRVTCMSNDEWMPPVNNQLCIPLDCQEEFNDPHLGKIEKHMYESSYTLTCKYGFWFGYGFWKLRVQCSAGGKWSPSYSCIPVYCKRPPYIRFAEVSSPINNQLWRVGTKLNYRCVGNYVFSINQHSQAVITCSSDGLWKPNPLYISCQPLFCLSKSKIIKLNPHAMIKGVSSLPGSKMEISCPNPLKMLDGETSLDITCKDGSWHPDLSSTICKKVRCIRSPPLANGMVAVSGEYDSALSFSCELGYKFVGNSPVYCSNDGEWVPSLDENKCVPVVCAKPDDMSTAIQFHFKAFKEKALVGERIKITCAKGHLFGNGTGELYVECRQDGEFYPRPDTTTCKLLTCNDPVDITNMERTSNNGSGGWPVDASVVYKCSPLFKSATRQESIECRSDGRWSREANLFSPCRLLTCPYISVQNAKVVEFKNDANGIHSFGSVLRFGCNNGFWFNQSLDIREVRCSEDGSWTPDPSKFICVPLLCEDLSNALIGGIGDQIYISKLATYCQKNYTASKCGVNDYGCFGFCKPPPAVNGATQNGSAPAIRGATAVYSCDDGKSKDVGVKAFTLKCTHSGLWEPRSVQCIQDSDFTCREPYQTKELISEPPRRYLVNEKVKYTCANGYQFDGRTEEEVVVSCRSNGRWMPDPRLLYCIQIACRNPTLDTKIMNNITIADVNTIGLQHKSDNLLFFGTTIEFSCRKGYWLWSSNVPFITSTCMKNKKFRPDPTSVDCQPQPCGNLPDIPPSSMRTYAGPSSLPRTRVVCDTGYKRRNTLNSKSFEISCSNQFWSYDDTNFCDVVDCGAPPKIPFATRRFLHTKYQSVATYKCIPGFWLSFKFAVSVDVRCMDDGRWYPDPLSQLHCTTVDCGEPPETTSATLSYDLTTYGSKAIYRCKNGRRFDHPSRPDQTIIQCQVNGFWSPGPENVARCIPRSCHHQTIPAYYNVKRQHGDLFYGGTWNYECADGFYSGHHKASFSITCLGNGTFSRPTGSCVSSYCGAPPRIRNAVVLKNEEQFVGRIQVVRYRCRSGMWISKGMNKRLEAELVCRDGSWTPNYHAIRCIPLTCDVFDAPISTFERGAKMTHSHPREQPIFNSTVTYECPYGQFIAAYSQRVVVARCAEDGRWTHDPEQIKCEPTECSTTADSNTLWSLTSNKIGDMAKFTCLRPFVITGNKTSIVRVCSENGTWLPPARCVPSNCPPPVVANTVHHTVSAGFSVPGIAYPSGSTVQIFCIPGYTSSSGPLTSECSDDGRWDPYVSSVICSPIKCPPFTMIGGNSQVKGDISFTFNSTVNFQCNSGFMMKPDLLSVSTRCREDGTWSNPIEKLRCVSVRCFFQMSAGGGYIYIDAKGNSGPLYKYQQTVTITCNTGGHTFANGMSTIYSKCSINGLFVPQIDNARCLPPMCATPHEKYYAEISYTSLTPGSTLTVKCDPLRWIGKKVKGNRWVITSDVSITTQCLESFKWLVDLDDVECIEATEQKKVIVPRSPNEQIYTVQLLPVSAIDYLPVPQDDSYVIKSEHPLRAINTWMMRSLKSRNGIAGRSFTNQQHVELSKALENRHYSLLVKTILRSLLRRINCNDVFVKDDLSRLRKVDNEQFAPTAKRSEWTPQYLSYVETKQRCEDYQYDGVGGSISTEFLLERLDFISEHFNSTFTETLLASGSVFDEGTGKFNKLKAKGKQISAAGYGNGTVYAVFDGYPNTAWSPTANGSPWVLEINLKRHHLVKEIWMKIKISTYFNITFAPNDASYPVQTFGPITLNEGEENEINGIEIEVVGSNSGISDVEKNITITWKEMQPAAIIRFTFASSSPVVYEARVYAEHAEWLIVYPIDRIFYLLVFVLIFSLVVLPIALLVDHKRFKDEIVHWIGGNPVEGIPCLIKIRVGQYPRFPMNVLMRIVCGGEEISARTLVKTRCPRTTLSRKHLLIGVSLSREPNKEFKVEFAPLPDGNDLEIDYYLSFPPLRYKWNVFKLEAMLEGKVWKTRRSDPPYPLMFNQRSTFELDKDAINDPHKYSIFKNTIIQKFIFSPIHPRYHKYTYTNLTCVQRFLILLASISTTIFTGVCMHILLNPKTGTDKTRTQDYLESNLPGLSFLSILVGTPVGAFLILFWRGVFVRCNENVLQREAQQKCPIEEVRPHRKLDEIFSPSKDEEKAASFQPLYNAMVNWIVERNRKARKIDTSEVRISEENLISVKSISSDNAEQVQERRDVPNTYQVVEEGFMMQFRTKESRTIFGLYMCLLLYSILMYLANYSLLDANRYGHQAGSLIRTTICLFVAGLFVAPFIEIFLIRILLRYHHLKRNDYKSMVDDFYGKYKEKEQDLEKQEYSSATAAESIEKITILHQNYSESRLINNTEKRSLITVRTDSNLDRVRETDDENMEYFTDYTGLLLNNGQDPSPHANEEDLRSEVERISIKTYSATSASSIPTRLSRISSRPTNLAQGYTADDLPQFPPNNDEMYDGTESVIIHQQPSARAVAPSEVQLHLFDYNLIDDGEYGEEIESGTAREAYFQGFPSEDSHNALSTRVLTDDYGGINRTFMIDHDRAPDISLRQTSASHGNPVSTSKSEPSLLERNLSTYDLMGNTFGVSSSSTKSLSDDDDDLHYTKEEGNIFANPELLIRGNNRQFPATKSHFSQRNTRQPDNWEDSRTVVSCDHSVTNMLTRTIRVENGPGTEPELPCCSTNIEIPPSSDESLASNYGLLAQSNTINRTFGKSNKLYCEDSNKDFPGIMRERSDDYVSDSFYPPRECSPVGKEFEDLSETSPSTSGNPRASTQRRHLDLRHSRPTKIQESRDACAQTRRVLNVIREIPVHEISRPHFQSHENISPRRCIPFPSARKSPSSGASDESFAPLSFHASSSYKSLDNANSGKFVAKLQKNERNENNVGLNPKPILTSVVDYFKSWKSRFVGPRYNGEQQQQTSLANVKPAVTAQPSVIVETKSPSSSRQLKSVPPPFGDLKEISKHQSATGHPSNEDFEG